MLNDSFLLFVLSGNVMVLSLAKGEEGTPTVYFLAERTPLGSLLLNICCMLVVGYDEEKGEEWAVILQKVFPLGENIPHSQL